MKEKSAYIDWSNKKALMKLRDSAIAAISSFILGYTLITGAGHSRELVGKELLKKVQELGDVTKSELVRATGYVSRRKDGTERLNYTRFFEELLRAKGLITQEEAFSGQDNMNLAMGKDYKDVIIDMRRRSSKEKNPSTQIAYFKTANRTLIGLKRDYELAIKEYSFWIKVDPTNAQNYFTRGLAKDLKKDYQDAIDDFTKALEFDPSSADIYFTRSLSRELLGDKKGFLADLDKAIELDPDNSEYSTYKKKVQNL